MENKDVGLVHHLPEFENKVNELKNDWNDQLKSEKKANLSKITTFLLGSVDILICTIDDLLDKGVDKKATVLMGMEQLYVYVERSPFVPVWLKPFLNLIRSYIVYTLLSVLIDWAVSKYRQGSWRNKEEAVKEEKELSLKKKSTKKVTKTKKSKKQK
jgi:hypothetical protein